MSEGFDFGNARVRARRADLFGAARYRELVALDVERMLAALSDSPYRADLEGAAPRHRGVPLLFEALRLNLARTLRELAGWYSGSAARDVALVVERWDLRNVVAVLRGQQARRAPDEMRAALVPAGRLGGDALEELAAQPGLRATIDLMMSWGVPSRDVASAAAGALAEYDTTGDFQALERAVERAAAHRVRRAVAGAAPEVGRVLRAGIDRANLLTAVRLHEGGAEWEARDLVDPAERFLPGGVLPVRLLVRLARADDRSAASAVLTDSPLPPAWRPAVARWAESGDPVRLGDELDEILTRGAAGMFSTTDPLGPGVPLAFVWAKENEVANLRTVGAGLDAGMPPDVIEEELVILW